MISFLLRMVIILCFVFVCVNANAFSIKSKKYDKPLQAKALKSQIPALKAESAKAVKDGQKELAAAYDKAIEARKLEAQGYSSGSGGKVRSGEKHYKEAMDEIARLKKAKSASDKESKAEIQEDAKDFLLAAKYERLSQNALGTSQSMKRKGNNALSAKYADMSAKLKQLADAYRIGNVKTIDAVSIELGYKKSTEKK